jgi:succinyl-CoA synthetase alpha subunit
MSTLRHRSFANLYKDSVTLMQLAARLRARAGIDEASCVMATPANLAQLAEASLAVDVAPAPSDLLVVVRGDADACDEALIEADAMLRAASASGTDDGGSVAFEQPLTSLVLAKAREPDADLALISVPGDYAAAEAKKALALGLHVMLFSDNVSLAEERAIKSYAREHDLLVMGPDCGTAIINGVPLGFANAVRRGDIGLVAASGTGLQEVTCRIHNLGGGVSQAIGTGGRDLHEDIGGITMLQGLRMLAQDPATRIIVLISKPPAPAIARAIETAALDAGKPVVVHFLGVARGALREGLHAATSLRHAADLAVALAADGPLPPATIHAPDAALAAVAEHASRMERSQHAVRALFTGGTFCYEAQLAFLNAGVACRSNAPAKGVEPFRGEFEGHVLLDLGDDEYTRGRPHPMIDPSVRNAMIRAQGRDASTSAILFDVVLGFGSHADPAAELAVALADTAGVARAAGRTLALIGHVCGTDDDVQNKEVQVATLEAAGAIIVDSNVEAAALAAHLAQRRAAN